MIHAFAAISESTPPPLSANNRDSKMPSSKRPKRDLEPDAKQEAPAEEPEIVEPQEEWPEPDDLFDLEFDSYDDADYDLEEDDFDGDEVYDENSEADEGTSLYRVVAMPHFTMLTN
jgi:hypothetical protein